MATTKFVNRARMLTSTTGTGSSITLTTAIAGYFTFAEAGLQDGDVVDYIIEQGSDFEIQHDQTYSSSGPSLTRGTPAASKVGGTAGTSKIDLNGSAQVAIVAVAKSLDVSTFTVKTTPDDDDLLWAHSDADSARRAVPVSGILSRVTTPALILLDSGSVSNAAALTVTFPSFTGYRYLQLEIFGVLPETNDRELRMVISSNGGSSFASSGYRYHNILARDGTGSIFGNNSTSNSYFLIAGHTSGSEAPANVADAGGIYGRIMMYGYDNDDVYPRFQWQMFFNANGQAWQQHGNGIRGTTEVTNAVQLYFESGNIVSGSWALYGYT